MKILFYLILFSILGLGGVWIYSQEGYMALTWGDYTYEASKRAFWLALIFGIVVMGCFSWLFIALVRLPSALRRRLREGKDRKGNFYLKQATNAFMLEAYTSSFKALKNADKYLQTERFKVLIRYMRGVVYIHQKDLAAAMGVFNALKETPEGEALGLKGLVLVALEDKRLDDACHTLETLNQQYPTDWGLKTLYETSLAAEKYEVALDLIPRLCDRKLIGNRYEVAAKLLHLKLKNHQQKGDDIDVVEVLQKAHQLNPAHVECAVELANELCIRKRYKEASRALEKSWGFVRHLSIARLYAVAEEGVSPLQAVQRLQRLFNLEAETSPSLETLVAYAEACINAEMWGEARKVLNDLSEAYPSWKDGSHALLVAYLQEKLKILENPLPNQKAVLQSLEALKPFL